MDTTTVTLQLPASLHDELESLAKDERRDLVEMIACLVEMAREHRVWPRDQLESPTRAFQRILERATDLGVTDLAERHDYYLYGTE